MVIARKMNSESGHRCTRYDSKWRSRRALAMTDTELRLMAAAATMGLSSHRFRLVFGHHRGLDVVQAELPGDGVGGGLIVAAVDPQSIHNVRRADFLDADASLVGQPSNGHSWHVGTSSSQITDSVVHYRVKGCVRR